MGKGEQTRALILARAAQLFNVQGYAGSSLSDVMRATGLEKGGIYNHFGSKEQLALEAFDYNLTLLRERLRLALNGKRNAIERLYVYITHFERLLSDPPVSGGCPIMNTAIEADDTNPPLRERARAAMEELRGALARIVAKGIERGEVRPEVDSEAAASVFIATLEGGIMLSKLYDDPAHLRYAAAHLRLVVEAYRKE